MRRNLEVLNQVLESGMIETYAWRAMAAALYAEPLLTFDLDIFVSLPEGRDHCNHGSRSK